MKKINYKTIFYVALLLLSGCTDIFEEDISSKNITLINPINNEVISANYIAFQWGNVEGVDQYRIRVFDTNYLIVKDTLLETNRYEMPISSGAYTWQVRGENFAYTTPYSKKEDFSVVIGDDLEQQLIFLTSPSDSIVTNSKLINLNWEALQVADSYTLEIKKTKNGITTLEKKEELVDTFYDLQEEVLEEEAEYTWGVQAKNETSTTRFFKRTILVDNSIPSTAIVNLPEENKVMSLLNPINFSWDLPLDTGDLKTAITSILEISSNEEFTVLEGRYETKVTNVSHEFSSSGIYYWRIRLRDEAGNIGENTNARMLSIQ